MSGKNKIKAFSDSIQVQAIKQGLVSVIPVLMIGAFSLVLKSFPISEYQNFITNRMGGLIYEFLDGIYNITFGLLSVYMSTVIGYHYAILKKGSGSALYLGCPLVSLASFIVLTGYDNLSINTMGPKGMFLAIVCSLISSGIFFKIYSRRKEIFLVSDGADIHLINSVKVIWPAVCTIGLFAVFNQILLLLSGGKNAHEMLLVVTKSLFLLVGDGFLSGLLFVIVSSILWFFGIHGSDVFEGVTDTLFTPNVYINAAAVSNGHAPTEILTKELFDVFVLMGGCGSAICLLIAIFLFSGRSGNKKLARIAALPMIFNINEIMVFGLPIIYNPTMLIPFLLTPVVCYLTSYLAMLSGIVPVVSSQVEWTTPILIGGYTATNSVKGVLLQLINLVIGILIYRPFVKKYDKERHDSLTEDYKKLVEIMKNSEELRKPVRLLFLDGNKGVFAKALAADLRKVLDNGSINMYYQPQYNLEGDCIGAEALLRWEHPVLGMIYPPLIMQLADESGILYELECQIVKKSINDAAQIKKETSENLKISVNVTGISMQNSQFEEYLIDMAKNIDTGLNICLELTEQATTNFNEEMQKRLKRLKSCGYQLAIDDFSMGSTSMQYLQVNCFNIVKLDGSLVQTSLSNDRNKEIIQSIVELSSHLGIEVLAEYVDSGELRDCMAQLGCYLYQGWLYAPALKINDLIQMLNKQSETGQ